MKNNLFSENYIVREQNSFFLCLFAIMKKWGRIRFLVFAAHIIKCPRVQMISHLKIIKTTKQQSFFWVQ